MKLAPLLVAVASGLTAIALLPSPVRAATGAEISRNARAALDTLYSTNPAARAVGKRAKAVLVFPRIIKGGFMVGGQVGNGAKSLSTTTLRNGIYVFFFSEKGLMGGIGLQGTKITKYTPGE